ncbi:hypothetical protein [Paraburkholderia rhizosphaerae]|nr:hypothetical protein [Paraburkholderia rhizosphaerae]
MAHDIYEVRMDGTSVVKGIDDATSSGINGAYHGQPVSLKCEPVLSAPDNVSDAQIEGMRFMKPDGTREELKQLYLSLHTTETGRQCAINADANPLFTVDVRFK